VTEVRHNARVLDATVPQSSRRVAAAGHERGRVRGAYAERHHVGVVTVKSALRVTRCNVPHEQCGVTARCDQCVVTNEAAAREIAFVLIQYSQRLRDDRWTALGR